MATISILSSKEITAMRIAGKAAAELLNFLGSLVIPGVTTDELDNAAATWAHERGYTHAPLNYHGFPKHICTSINEVACHGIPSKQTLINGDIINIDVTLNVNGWHGDTSRTFIVGVATDKINHLVESTRCALMKGIEIVRPNINISEIGRVIEQYATSENLHIIKEFCGHGIGRAMHMEPAIHHIYIPNHIKLCAGMCFTIEPILSIEPSEIEVLEDNWTVITKNKSFSAQFEHTILVTEDGYEILTISN